MIYTKKRQKRLSKFIALIMVLVLATAAVLPVMVLAEGKAEKVVRVGWFESPFSLTDKLGRRSGYSYEYQRKISAYTGWTYNYVVDSWSNLFEMLKKGEIDLLSDVTYTPERSKEMLFADLPMGSEEYSIYTLNGNKEISPENISSLNGKKIGVYKDSYQLGLLKNWTKNHGLSVEIMEISADFDNCIIMLQQGVFDAFCILNSNSYSSIMEPVCQIGSSDFFFAVNKNRPDLLNDMNAALNKIQENNRFYNAELYNKYIISTEINLNLSQAESKWLEQHGNIRVGYQDNYLAFCDADNNGNLTGALKDYLDYAEKSFGGKIKFSTVAYPTISAAVEDMKKGKIDCVFPANITEYEAETSDLLVSPTLMTTEMYAIVRESDKKSFLDKTDITVAVNKGNMNYEYFLIDNFSDWKIKRFDNTSDCLKGVFKGKADCLLISNYRSSSVERECRKYRLETISTGVRMDYCFALLEGETELYSILSKIKTIIPSSSINATLVYYASEASKVELKDILKDNLPAFVSLILFVVLLIVFLFLRALRARKKAIERQQLILATQLDKLTGLYTRNFFLEYAVKLTESHPEQPMDAIVVNINKFHTVNSLKGHAFGDEVLIAIADELKVIAEENSGIASRTEGDRFAIYCRHLDDYSEILDRLNAKMENLVQNSIIELRMGVMPWQEGIPVIEQFHYAHTACNLARDKYTDNIIVYDKKINDLEEFNSRLLNDLNYAIENKEFEVYYQPKYDVLSDSPIPRSAEALIRWNHHELGLITPNSFIPLFEKNGYIGTLDKYVWEETAKQVAEWRDKYGILFPVSVNLSRIDIFDPTLEETLDSLTEKYGLDNSLIHLEITESAYTENAEQIFKTVTRLRNKGYIIEMDDFGTGYSSLGTLHSMPIDILKMDKSFIDDIEHDQKNVKLVELIIGIAKSLKTPVIAEGVETEAQMALLKKLGCRFIQGYYLSRPIPASDFEANIIKSIADEDKDS